MLTEPSVAFEYNEVALTMMLMMCAGGNRDGGHDEVHECVTDEHMMMVANRDLELMLVPKCMMMRLLMRMLLLSICP